MDILQAAQFGGWAFAALILAGVVWKVADGTLTSGRLLDRSLTQQEKALPAIEANTGALRELLTEVRNMREDLNNLQRLLDDVRRR